MIYEILYGSSSSNSLKYTDNAYSNFIHIILLKFLLLVLSMNKVVDYIQTQWRVGCVLLIVELIMAVRHVSICDWLDQNQQNLSDGLGICIIGPY